MAPPVEEKTTRAPTDRAASSTRTVPITFTAASKSGRSTETRTSAWAARWKQTSGRSSAKRSSSGSRISSTCSRACWLTFSRFPLERLSTMSTESPRAIRASTRFEPMNPAPPVTSAFTPRILLVPMFISFEGLDGCGKTTQVELLEAFLEMRDVEVVATREPGGTELGETLRAIVLHGQKVSPWAEAAVFAAARAELVEQVIEPALERGATVVSDRFVDSSLVYQGVARGLGIENVLQLNLHATKGLLPDRTFLLLVDEKLSESRVGEERDRMERESAEFRRLVGDGYRRLAEMFPERIVALDGTQPREPIARQVRQAL